VDFALIATPDDTVMEMGSFMVSSPVPPVPEVIRLRVSGLVAQTPSAQYAGAPMSDAKDHCTAPQDTNVEFVHLARACARPQKFGSGELRRVFGTGL
jgi:hypothetical protein